MQFKCVCPVQFDISHRQAALLQRIHRNPMLRPIIHPRMDQLGGEMATIRFRRQADRVPRSHGPRDREIHVGHGLVDHGGYGEHSCAALGIQSSVQDFLYLVAKQRERHRDIREEMREPAAFSDMLRPVPTPLKSRKFRTEGDEARSSIHALLVENIRQLLQRSDLGRRCVTEHQTAEIGETGGYLLSRLVGVPGRIPFFDLFDSTGSPIVVAYVLSSASIRSTR